MTATITHDMTPTQAAAVLIADDITAGRTPDLTQIANVSGLTRAEVSDLRDLIVSGNRGSLLGLPLTRTPQPPRAPMRRSECPHCGASVVVLTRHVRDRHEVTP